MDYMIHFLWLNHFSRTPSSSFFMLGYNLVHIVTLYAKYAFGFLSKHNFTLAYHFVCEILGCNETHLFRHARFSLQVYFLKLAYRWFPSTKDYTHQPSLTPYYAYSNTLYSGKWTNLTTIEVSLYLKYILPYMGSIT